VIDQVAAKGGAAADGAKNGRGPGAAARTAGRVLALQLVYSFEQNHYADDGHLVPSEAQAGVEPDAARFACELFDGFVAERVAVDAAVDQRLENWTIQRLSVIDRAILRLGAFELLYRPATPAKVAINEWIELAKAFGSEAKTPKLVNGVLDRIAREHGLGGMKPGARPSDSPKPDPAG
jgi:N utilization substance protein B